MAENVANLGEMVGLHLQTFEARESISDGRGFHHADGFGLFDCGHLERDEARERRYSWDIVRLYSNGVEVL